jgi:hypothetical protein
MAKPLRVAFVKFGGLAAGGTERWLQMMAAGLPREKFAVDYFYCDAAPYVGSDFRHPDTDPARLEFMEQSGVPLIKFHVGQKDITKVTHDWLGTDFWEVFDEADYDIVQTAIAGPAEYPYHLMDLPVVEFVALAAGVNSTSNVALTIHCSQWQRRRWGQRGGDLYRSDVISNPAAPPSINSGLRAELRIPDGALVAGFHQRVQDEIFSPIPLDSFSQVAAADRWFLIMGGSSVYREQAHDLGLEQVLFVDHHGGAEQISKFLNTLDIFAHGRADGETFGTVFAEAMMHGLPCLSHRSSVANAQRETMGPAGLFADGEVDYSAKLELLFSDAVVRGSLAAKARPHAEQYYSLETALSLLAEDYERVVGDAQTGQSSRPVAYGECDLGFLLAGDLEDDHSVARCVLVGGIPQDPIGELLPLLLSPGDRYHEVGTANTALPIIAALAGANCSCDFLPGPEVEALEASLYLNNLEERVAVRVLGQPETAGLLVPDSADVVTVNNSLMLEEMFSVLSSVLATPTPVVVLALGGKRGPVRRMRKSGYKVAVLGPRRWAVCIHGATGPEVSSAYSAWRSTRRRARAQALAAVPSSALLRARRIIGSVVAAGRSRLRN